MTPSLQFDIQAKSMSARAAIIKTPHGQVSTPAFMPVATQGVVKTLEVSEVKTVGANIVLANNYHLYLRPGVHAVQNWGGIHSFMGWDGPILTDSGGYQAFSLGNLKKISDKGVLFQSHLDGSPHLFTPETATERQQALGADIIMCFDQCIAADETEEKVRLAMVRTHLWAAICHQINAGNHQQALFGIVQGGIFPHLREESAKTITAMDFSGYAIGGLAVGESKRVMYQVTEQVASLLPTDKPRYLMGVGSPEDLVECVSRGVDIFDCALPTRVARNGGLFTQTGRVNISSARFKNKMEPVDEECDCTTCSNYSSAYLHYLFKIGELLGLKLATVHNLRFILRLMERMRCAIVEGTFSQYRHEFLTRYKPTDETKRLSQKQQWLKTKGILT